MKALYLHSSGEPMTGSKPMLWIDRQGYSLQTRYTSIQPSCTEAEEMRVRSGLPCS